ncbi:MAG TPA: glutamate racemase [Gemmatimonadaceae bacterium]|nr:glutamate racemase [Gemmatimonadaceae bacterium]
MTRNTGPTRAVRPNGPPPRSPAAPIGVFDSGIGGLTVVRELMRQLPHESIIYFGDTARVPYGPKSPDTVRRYSHEISAFLLAEGVKAIVVACNTATAHALPALGDELPVPVIGVAEPGAQAAVASSSSGRIGVIGTTGTVKSGAYDRAIHAIAPHALVTSRPCPLFVPLVEEGWLDTEPTRLIAREYLAPLHDAGVDAVVLGCTHYPLLKPVIGEVLGAGVRLVDPAEQTAAETKRVLDARELRAPSTRGRATYRFIASDAPEQFLRLGQRFLGAAIERVDTLTLG